MDRRSKKQVNLKPDYAAELNGALVLDSSPTYTGNRSMIINFYFNHNKIIWYSFL